MSQRRTLYEVLEVPANASAEEIKRSYRRLAKQHHPDTQTSASPQAAADAAANSERIREINAAYEVLCHRESRRRYDVQIGQATATNRVQVQQRVQRVQQTVTDEERLRQLWIRQVYTPLNRTLSRILRSLKPQLNALSADPFDIELVDAFSDYLDRCSEQFDRAHALFRQHPNPSTLAGVASRLYYSLQRLEDALDELKYFPLNFDERHLHTGQELFRIAQGLRQEAVEVLQDSLSC
jgi:molecular chaperone DnaJ